MSFEERTRLIKRIESLRGSSVICYLTSLRPNIPAQIADDQVRIFYDQLLMLKDPPVEKLDLFLVSNGGAGTVPWTIVSLAREFSRQFSVLIPYRAYSAATLIALGADEIVMHSLGQLGPIDPSVANAFNPRDPQTNQLMQISVEDVKAYVQFIKSTVGITHEDELVKTIEILAEKIHPLALGNVERFVQQSRMMARKILRTHMDSVEDHVIDDIIENLASKLYFHGHPINRKEARQDLRLKVKEEVDPGIEGAMWDLYLEYEREFENNKIFSPLEDLNAQLANIQAPPAVPIPMPPPGMPQIMPNMMTAPITTSKEYEQVFALLESADGGSMLKLRKRFTAYKQGIQLQVQEEPLEQGWVTYYSKQEAEEVPSSS